jgi:hypothetical protein
MGYAILVPSLWYSLRRSPVSIVDFFTAIVGPTMASLCMGGIVFLGHFALSGQGDLVVVGVCSLIGLSTYLLLYALTPGGLPMLRELGRYVVPKLFGQAERDDRRASNAHGSGNGMGIGGYEERTKEAKQ